ncbi:variable surface protein Vir26-like, truncated, partial [Plasmodium vivax]
VIIFIDEIINVICLYIHIYIIISVFLQYRFIQNSNFYKIYNEFGWICNHHNYLDKGDSCYNVLSNGLSGSDVVTNLLKELYSNLYRIYYTIEDKKNDYFDENRDIVKKMGCIYLKYWLYDQITSKGFNGLQIINLFEEFNKHVQGKIQGISKDYCKFNQLSLDQIKKIKKVYALNSILHESDKNPETCVNNHCKYMDYFEEALTEFINSIKKCADNPLEKEYCDEFEDFLKICTGG